MDRGSAHPGELPAGPAYLRGDPALLQTSPLPGGTAELTTLRSEKMNHSSQKPARDLKAERRERDAFILLQHVYTYSGNVPEIPISLESAAKALDFGAADTHRLAEHLIYAGLFKREKSGAISLSAEGREYIDQLAWRRRSVRLPAPPEAEPDERDPLIEDIPP